MGRLHTAYFTEYSSVTKVVDVCFNYLKQLSSYLHRCDHNACSGWQNSWEKLYRGEKIQGRIEGGKSAHG